VGSAAPLKVRDSVEARVGQRPSVTVACVTNDLITAEELEAMTPDERAAAVRSRIVTDLDELPDGFRARVVENLDRLNAEHSG